MLPKNKPITKEALEQFMNSNDVKLPTGMYPNRKARRMKDSTKINSTNNRKPTKGRIKLRKEAFGRASKEPITIVTGKTARKKSKETNVE
jgi:hypothetical protein